MIITYYRYFISLGYMSKYEVNAEKETPTYYHLEKGTYIGVQPRARIDKREENKVILKDRTNYPYIDFYSTEDPSREHAVKSILKFLTEEWGLN